MPRDIRSFFASAAPAAKRQKRSADAPETKPADAASASEADIAVEAEKPVEADAAAESTKQPTEIDGDAEQEAEELTSDIESFKQLQTNLKALMDASWFQQLQKQFTQSYFRSLVAFLIKEELAKRTIYPPPRDVFASLRDCAFSSLKVVILGQDPYHGPGQAHGLSFSVGAGVPPPPSLKNIYKEAMSDVEIQRPSHGCLTCWSKQGVLLLNTVLTVRKGEPNSHKKQGWERFTDAVIQNINANASNVVFLLWGKPAQEKGAIINKSRHLVVVSSHPSPLGATKTNAPFIGSKCFSRANEYLVANGKEPIDWQVL